MAVRGPQAPGDCGTDIAQTDDGYGQAFLGSG